MMNLAELAGKDSLSRRYFMEKTAKLSLGVSLSVPFLPRNFQAQEGAKGKNLIYIYLKGGMSHLDTFDAKRDGSAVMGSTTTLNTKVDDLKFGGNLPKLAQMADKLAVIRGMNSTNGAHEEGEYIMRRGYNKRATIVHPTMGPFAEKMLGKRNEVLPDSVIIGESTSNAGWLDPSMSPLPIADPAGGVPNTTITTNQERFDRRMKMAKGLGQKFIEKYKYTGPESYVEYYDQATKLLKSDELKAFDISGEDSSLYGTERLGQGCLLARKLIENGVRVVEVVSGGWDMHIGLRESLNSRVPVVDMAVSGLIKDLEQRGLLDSTIIAIGTEFGRTPDFNINDGRDHFPAAYSCVLAGGGIKGGTAYSETDGTGKKVKGPLVKPEDFLSTIGYGLGIDTSEVVYSATQRPFTFGGKGKPITELFG
ncbi:MAG: DUF1501 domain-containing protein [Verrucomicrobiales bacterium]|nr:DUF1501 domain-containing protein [Verrucomicrobiales bacterium]